MRLAERDDAAGALDAVQREFMREFIENWARSLSEARTPASSMRRMAECLVRTEAWKPVSSPKADIRNARARREPATARRTCRFPRSPPRAVSRSTPPDPTLS